MYRPSLTTVVSVLFLAYMANSMWNIVQLYLPPPACPESELTIFILSVSGLNFNFQRTKPAFQTW